MEGVKEGSDRPGLRISLVEKSTPFCPHGFVFVEKVAIL